MTRVGVVLSPTAIDRDDRRPRTLQIDTTIKVGKIGQHIDRAGQASGKRDRVDTCCGVRVKHRLAQTARTRVSQRRDHKSGIGRRRRRREHHQRTCTRRR